MKKFICSILLMLVAGASWGLEEPEKVLTLQESVKWALTNNQDLLLLLEKKYVAEQKIKEANSYFFPQLSVSGAYTRLRVTTPTTLPPALGGSSLAVGVTNHYAARASLTQYLFTGGYLLNQKLVAEADLDANKWEYEETKRQVIMKVVEKFYSLLYLQYLLDLSGESKKIVQHYIDITPRDNVKKYELYLLELEKAQLDNDSALTEDELSVAQMEFNKSVGFELSSEIKVMGDFKVPSVDEERKTVYIYHAQAIDCAPLLQELMYEEKKIQHKIGQAFSERYPTIVMGADYERSGLSADLQGRNWTATLALHLPIFNGWRSWAKVRQLRGELKQSNLLRVKVTDDLKMEVQEAYIQILRAEKNNELFLKTKEQAQKALDSVEKYYQQDQATATELLAVFEKYRETIMRELQNRHEYTINDIRLKVLTEEYSVNYGL